MDFIMQVCGAMLAVAGTLIVLTIAVMVFYIAIVGVQSHHEEYKKKKNKKDNKK